MVDKALRKLCSVIPSLSICIGIDTQGNAQPAHTLHSMKELPLLFRTMTQNGALRFGALDRWWAAEH